MAPEREVRWDGRPQGSGGCAESPVRCPSAWRGQSTRRRCRRPERHLVLERPGGRLLDVRVQGHVRPVIIVPFHEPFQRIRLHFRRVDGAGGAGRPCHIKEQRQFSLYLAVHALYLAVCLGVGDPGEYVPYVQAFQVFFELGYALGLLFGLGNVKVGAAVGQYGFRLAVLCYGAVQHLYGVLGGGLVERAPSGHKAGGVILVAYQPAPIIQLLVVRMPHGVGVLALVPDPLAAPLLSFVLCRVAGLPQYFVEYAPRDARAPVPGAVPYSACAGPDQAARRQNGRLPFPAGGPLLGLPVSAGNTILSFGAFLNPARSLWTHPTDMPTVPAMVAFLEPFPSRLRCILLWTGLIFS